MNSEQEAIAAAEREAAAMPYEGVKVVYNYDNGLYWVCTWSYENNDAETTIYSIAPKQKSRWSLW